MEETGQTATDSRGNPSFCTGIAQAARPMPEWLRPHKRRWLSAGGMKGLLALDGRPFGPWFDEVKPRLRVVLTPSRNNGPAPVKSYLVGQVWAASLAHGVKLVEPEKAPSVAELQREIEGLRLAVAVAQGRVVVKTVVEDRTGESLDLIRMMIAATEPQPVAGVYFLLTESGEVAYVGQSKNVLARMSGHTGKLYARVRMIPVQDDKQRLEVEARMIRLLKPPLNTNGIERRVP